MEERGLVGLEARTPDGVEVGRISEVVTDEKSGEATYVIVESGETLLEVPISSLSLDPDEEFAVFHADASDEEPGDHVGEEASPEGYAPLASDTEDDEPHEGQFVTAPTDPEAAISPEEAQRETGEAGGWEDEASSPDSGYPRNDVFIDPDTGDELTDPAMNDGEGLADEAAKLLVGTGIDVRVAVDGVVELTGVAGSKDQLEGLVGEIRSLTEVLDVDTTDVDVR